MPVQDTIKAQSPFAKGRQIRIYLSYGYDSREVLVRRIKANLENHGYDVCMRFSTSNAPQKGL